MASTVVPPGATSIDVAGSFGSSFEVFPSANWATELPWIAGVNTFHVDFTTPAPIGAIMYYFVVGASTPGPPTSPVTLGSYQDEVRRLLRDKTTPGAQVIWSDADLTAFINRAMQQRDLDLGLNRSLISYAFTTSVFRYPFASVVAGGTVVDGSPSPNPMDVLSLTIYPIGGPPPTGGIKYPMARRPYSFVANFTSTSWNSYPRWYAVFGPSTVYVAPPPAGPYLAEWDFKTWASKLVNTTDPDPMPYPYTDPIPFMAASLAKMESQDPSGAQFFEGQYKGRLNLVRSGSRPFAVRDPFFDLPRR